VPAWGFATVTESLVPEVPVGEKFYGYFPMASETVMEPAKVSPSGFLDGISHRRALPRVYNEYIRSAVDPMHAHGREDIEALLRPLFTTGWLVDDFLEDNQFFGASTIILSSASSKTAYATAAQLARRKDLRVIGLTALKNVDFVRALGAYTDVLTYDQLAQLDAQAPSVYLDYAGSAELRRSLHILLAHLKYSCLIGASHVDKVGSASGLPGPKPTFLFVPTQAAKRATEWGMAGLVERMVRDWTTFTERATNLSHPWLQVHHHQGPAAAQAVYALVQSGKTDPLAGHIVSL
jgi:hypothetical protein